MCIPILLALNELASFIGITHRIVNSTLAIGFSNAHSKTIWTFLTDFDLGFITCYQFLNFAFAFFRLAKAFLEQQRIESSETDEMVLFRGTGWVAFGILLGAVETCVGFIYPQFGLVLTRRILRLLGRASLVIGIFKGLDVSEDFQMVREEILAGTGKRSFRGSRIRPLISDPRLSTFRQVSPEATQAALNAFREKQQPLSRPLSIGSPSFPPGSRVTVHFDAASGRAPTLQMRFSGLEMPNPAEIVETVKSRPASEWLSRAPSQSSSYYANSTMTRQTNALDMPDMPPPPVASLSTFEAAERQPEPEREPLPQPIVVPNIFTHSRDISNMSMNSGFQESVNSVDFSMTDLASQFPVPGLPPNISQQVRVQAMRNSSGLRNSLAVVPEASPRMESYAAEGRGRDRNYSNSPRRMPNRTSAVLAPAPLDPFTDDDTQIGVTLPAPLRNSEHARQMSLALSSALTTDSSLFTRPQFSPQPASSLITSPSTAQTEDPFKYDQVGAARASVVPPLPPVQEYVESQSPSSLYSNHDRGKSMETLDISWLTRPGPSISEEYDESEDFTVERAMRRKISPGSNSSRRRSRSAPRIKSIGKAPRRYTPSPTTSASYTRDSVYVEPIAIPPKGLYGFANVELEQGSLNGSMISGPLRDSEVFGRWGDSLR
ncbi:hypothetical protein BT96DRAFT_917069 [Gymnopus androsaceus JB14]|uniref:Uncharacterized protein n=1 Tax=Gymnopus androsaceus JB14 TaxID=1447944 RepID=A0A6A4I0Q1_9AGAR|nr:hypothetical protein BT96DRAFT_917069 [Gymnopus androsaceus JB14]